MSGAVCKPSQNRESSSKAGVGTAVSSGGCSRPKKSGRGGVGLSKGGRDDEVSSRAMKSLGSFQWYSAMTV